MEFERDLAKGGILSDSVVGVSKALDDLSDVKHWAGDLDGAIATLNESLAILRSAAAKQSASASSRHRVAAGLSKLGGLLLIKGDVEGAASAHKESFDILLQFSHSEESMQ